jgi:aquaporin Z
MHTGLHNGRGETDSGTRVQGVETMKAPWVLFFSELVGTALLVVVGLSLVIVDFGAGSPLANLLPNPGVRRLITGFLFGTTGGLIALSPVGKVSGAHINPVVTLAFWLQGKMRTGHAVGYVMAQLGGAILGALPLLAWGRMGRSVQFGATLPGPGYGAGVAMLGEVLTTFALIVGLFFFLSHRRIRSFTPLLFPFLYAVMVYLEAPISGTSTNPARSLGPALVSGDWRDWWVYWVGPALGTFLGLAAHRLTWRGLEAEVAKIYHFEHDPYGVFKKVERMVEDSLE